MIMIERMLVAGLIVLMAMLNSAPIAAFVVAPARAVVAALADLPNTTSTASWNANLSSLRVLGQPRSMQRPGQAIITVRVHR